MRNPSSMALALLGLAFGCTEPDIRETENTTPIPNPDPSTNINPDPDPDPDPKPEPDPVPCSKDSEAIRGVDANMCTPGFELPAADGTMIRLADYEGQIVLLEFVTMWCGTCRQAAPEFQEYSVERADDPVEVITLIHEDVFGDTPTTDDIEAWTSQFTITHPVVSDVSGEAKKAWSRGGTIPTPMTYVVDQFGYIRFFAGGNGTIAEFDEAIEALLTE
ncbi:MAG: TlpA disulfide reductase family protein [Myxococcota bacterium]